MRYLKISLPLLTLISFLFIGKKSTAQDFVPFGEFSDEVIQMKQCSFDVDAEAVVLLHEAKSFYDDSYHLVTDHHIRIKILKEKGLNSANVSIPFYRRDDYEQVIVQKAATFNMENGSLASSPVQRKSIFTRNTNDRWGEMVFSFPSVKVGSILEYQYQSTMKSYGGLEEWVFQEERPVVTSQYTLLIVPNTEFTYQVRKRPDYQAIVKSNASSGSVYFEMNNIPGLDNEPYMDSRKDYLQKVIFQLSAYRRGDGFGGSKYMTSWNEVVRELNTHKSFGYVIGKTVPGTDEFINGVKAITNEQERMKKIYQYVSSNMNWNGMYGRFVEDGLKGAWQKKTGTSGEINFILINLLKEAGLDVYPALVSPRWHGNVDKSYPFVDQFVNVVACVKINGKPYYLDAVEKYTPATFTPYDLLNTTGLLVSKKDGGLIEITNDSLVYSEIILNRIKVKDDNSIEGSTTVRSAEYARVRKLEQYVDDKTAFMNRNFKNEKFSMEIGNFEVEGNSNDSMVFVQHCDFTAKLGSAGEYGYVPLNLFSGFTSNPFLRDKRFSNINFGYKRTVTVITDISLPAGFVVEDLPKAIKLRSESNDIIMSRVVEYNREENSVIATIKFEFFKSLYGAEQYDMLQAFYKKMFQFLDEPVLLKKK